ncbi:anaerobic carbon-monoxide dehydrogenase catalytic subunit [Desulfococcus multivorans]|uniref:Carbon monoxide dehydrogenase n=1 Tax=Desulfococcus multivorans DSM 2059 TaxID=1121405 RepID=S7TNN8_DESML|nr:anaerobic carbon-monoxide dehydrogenase catalytic subunit [Desulfococcus multivorans]AOY57705.1 CooS1: carbon monoxide dehydrogenase, catalytic subunit [Desulfococcus multivorans]AQV00101.1 carbon-monoxide dehydrogenase catalytic subunit [Desulfococcus multivorans]EPR38787.1 carbon-monoxide dehydrogenase, catalytic subunit [Desulfococcus multivorans DSM 2059]SJZ79374.1 carbon-monoxide dehydrogenase catalytic subunit [Desulfococcus multivorans DSM 2059]
MAEKKISKTIEAPVNLRDLTICDATVQMLEKARRDGVETAFDRAISMKACPIGADSACCKHCFMGPCRLNAKDPYGKVGVCGATIDTIMARNFARAVASGSAAHTDHGMGMLDLFREVVKGHAPEYRIKDVQKLEQVAQSIGIEVEGRTPEDIAMDLYKELERTYTQVEGEIPFAQRAPKKTQETWRKYDMIPRGSMREIMEMMHRTHMGVDQDFENLTKQFSRTALADGWGGSMVATEISDILFGTPKPVAVEVNMGVLKEDHVNVIVHGHEPNMFESMLVSVNEPTLIQAAKDAGAKGINLVGMCCSGAEMMSRHGVPHAGNFMSTEAILVTGAVDAMVVDVQCIKQGLVKVAECYGTPLLTTNYRCHIEGAQHIQFNETKPSECTDEMVIKAITRFKSRNKPIEIPKMRNMGIHGFSHEYINYMLGGSFRGSYTPLNDNIINGRIRGVAGVVGCTNPRVKQDWVHVELVKELIRNDVLVVQTGCSQVALAKAGLLTPEAAHLAGPGLSEVCETVGMPPVLGLGSCVDNSRILIACTEMVKTGGLGDSIADLPVAGAAPEYMSEKAIAIGQYFVASGVYTVFGVTFPIVKDTKFHDMLFRRMEEEWGLGKWGFTPDPYEMARLMIAHIDKKRKALGIDKARERVMMDFADRQKLEA